MLQPAVLSVVGGYAANCAPKGVTLDVPEPLTDLYDKQASDCSLAELQDQAETLFERVTVTKEQVNHYSLLMYFKIKA